MATASFSFPNIFNGYVNSFNGSKRSDITTALAFDYGITTIYSFINKINTKASELPPGLSREQNINRAGALVIQDLIRKKLKIMSASSPAADTMREKIRAQHTTYGLGSLSDQEIMKQANERLVQYFDTTNFVEKLVGDMPSVGSLNTGSKQVKDGYSTYLKNLFSNQTLTDIRKLYLEASKGAVDQCKGILCTRPSCGTCYLCNCWWDPLMVQSTNQMVECEHILPILPALSHLWLFRTPNQAATPPPISQQLQNALKIEYAWSHKCCNQIKLDKNFTKLNKLYGKYEIDTDGVNEFLVALNTSARSDCLAIKQYSNKPKDDECEESCPGSDISDIPAPHKLPCNIDPSLAPLAIKLAPNQLLGKRLKKIIDTQNGNLDIIASSMDATNTDGPMDVPYYYYLVLCKFKLLAAIDTPSFLHDMLLGWSKPKPVEAKGIGNPVPFVDSCQAGLKALKNTKETEAESKLTEITQLNADIVRSLNKVKSAIATWPEPVPPKVNDLYMQIKNSTPNISDQLKELLASSRAKLEQIEPEAEEARNAMRTRTRQQSSPFAEPRSKKRGAPVSPSAEDEIANQVIAAADTARVIRDKLLVLTVENARIIKNNDTKKIKDEEYNILRAEATSAIQRLSNYNTEYTNKYMILIGSGETADNAHEQAAVAARLAAGCPPQSDIAAPTVGGMTADSMIVDKDDFDSMQYERPQSLPDQAEPMEFEPSIIDIWGDSTLNSLAARQERLQKIIAGAPTLSEKIKQDMWTSIASGELSNYPSEQDLIILELLINNAFNPTPIEIDESISSVFLSKEEIESLIPESKPTLVPASKPTLVPASKPRSILGALPFTSLNKKTIKKDKKTILPFTSLNIKIRKSKKRDKKTTLPSSSRKGAKTTRRGGMGKCYIQNMADGNLRIIRGRRRYITKNFNLDPRAQLYINQNANEPNINCIKVAQNLDNQLKKLRKTRKRS